MKNRSLLPCLLCALLLAAPGDGLAASKAASTSGAAPVAAQTAASSEGIRVVKNQGTTAGSYTMPAAVNRALKHNPGLGAQSAQSMSSEEGRKSARGAFGPKLGATYQVNKQFRETYPASTKPPELGTYAAGVEVSQPVFQGFRLLANYQKAALKADSDKASLRQAELSMTEKVQTNFVNYLRSIEDIRSKREQLERLRDQLRITTAFYDVGLRPKLDVLQAQVDVSNAESTLISAENTRETTLAMLNTLLGLDAGAQVAYAGQLTPAPFRRNLEQCLEAAYRQRPDLDVAAKAVAMAQKDQRVVQSDYYPKVEAYYNISGTGNAPDLREAGNRGSRGTTWEVGAKASWDVFQWGTTYYADRQAGHLVTRMRHEEEDLKLNVGYDVKSKLLALREAEKRISVGERGLAQAREAYRVALASYQEQVGTNFDVLDASSKLTAAEATLTSAKADYLVALSQMYVSMGEFHPDLLH